MLRLRVGLAKPVAEVRCQPAQVWTEAGKLGKHLGGGQVTDAGSVAIALRVRAGQADVGQGGFGHASNSNDGLFPDRRDTRTTILAVSRGSTHGGSDLVRSRMATQCWSVS